MDIGRMRSRVTLQAPSTTQDDIGGVTDDWTDVATIYADIRNTSGLEAIRGGAESSLVKSSVRIRNRSGVTSGMRLLLGEVAYNITSVLPDARRRFLDLVCEVVS